MNDIKEQMQKDKKDRLLRQTKSEYHLDQGLDQTKFAGQPNGYISESTNNPNPVLVSHSIIEAKEDRVKDMLAKEAMNKKIAIQEAYNDYSTPNTIMDTGQHVDLAYGRSKAPNDRGFKHISDSTRRYAQPKLIKNILQGHASIYYCTSHDEILGYNNRSVFDNRLHTKETHCEVMKLSDAQILSEFPEIRTLLANINSLSTNLSVAQPSSNSDISESGCYNPLKRKRA